MLINRTGTGHDSSARGQCTRARREVTEPDKPLTGDPTRLLNLGRGVSAELALMVCRRTDRLRFSSRPRSCRTSDHNGGAPASWWVWFSMATSKALLAVSSAKKRRIAPSPYIAERSCTRCGRSTTQDRWPTSSSCERQTTDSPICAGSLHPKQLLSFTYALVSRPYRSSAVTGYSLHLW
jgi:hypothetical protein